MIVPGAEPGDRKGRHYAGPSTLAAWASVVAGLAPARCFLYILTIMLY